MSSIACGFPKRARSSSRITSLSTRRASARRARRRSGRQAAAGAGVGPGQLHYVLGVAKAYATRVGAGPFPTELEDEVGEHLRVKGNEYGSVTGRPRRCGWFDAAALKRSVQLNGVSGICV